MAAMETKTEVFPTLRPFENLQKVVTKVDDTSTLSSVDQRAVENSCLRLYEISARNAEECDILPTLDRRSTVKYLRSGLKRLNAMYQCLDASRPWIVYWILHSLELLGEEILDEDKDEVVDFLLTCQNPEGGFGGGPGQISHLAPTYASVNALCILGTEKAYNAIDRPNLAKWLSKLRLEDGSFVMHEDGEVDIRGVYCALSVAKLTNVYSEAMFTNTAQWIVGCQSYEGGFSAAPGLEAHGGYSFCGLAALMMLKHERLCNLDSLLLWLVNRQMGMEGGFQGRTNKLVDGCYSFWQGGAFPLIHKMLVKDEGGSKLDTVSMERWLFNQEALQEYVLICAQDRRGGLCDKPGKSRDFYHTCYGLSGLSIAQHFGGGNIAHKMIVGDKSNELEPTHPLHNIGVQASEDALDFFGKLPVPSI